MAHASPAYRLQLFGTFRLERQTQLVRLPTRKFESLLAYLALFPEPHPREKLAALFWGDTSDDQARASLRNALAVLRRHVNDDLILASRDNAQLNPDLSLWIDVREFNHAIQAGLKSANRAEQALLENLPTAIALYRGELLTDFYDEWVLPERDRLCGFYLEALLALAQQMRSQSEYAHAIDLARQVLAVDPGNEKAHQTLIFCYATTGDRNTALKQYDECEHILREQVGVEPLPETRSLHQWVKLSELRSDSRQTQLTNLPTPLTDFIGRGEASQHIKQLILQKRLVTLTGPGGCGKTRLALHVASDLVTAFSDGVWWAGLAALTDAATVLQAIANALGVRESPGHALIETLTVHLRGKHLLLLLDGCEHLVDACAPLAEVLLNHCPHLSLLVTGREPLDIAGETVYLVAPLTCPKISRPFAIDSPKLIDELMQYDAVQLFVARAKAVKSEFGLNDRNALTIADICVRLDGIPLAIELAAARIKAITVTQIAERLNDRFRLLTNNSRTALQHHQTLRATMDWSYDSLGEIERRLLRRLSAFVVGWTLEAAESICADDALLRRSDVLDVLTHLVTKSLVVFESEGDIVRYRMLETVREYAREKLIASGEATDLYTRHRDWFMAFAEATEPKLRRAGQMFWLDRIQADYENLRAAMRWSLRRPNVCEIDIECGLRIVGALRQFWAMRCQLKEGQVWLADALTLSERLESVPQNPVLQSARAKALNGAGLLAYLQGEQVRAAEFSEKSVRIARALNDRWLVAASLYVLGEYQRNHLQNIAQAQALVEEGLTLVRAEGDDWLTAVLLINAGLQSRLLGDLAHAATYFAEGLTLTEKVGDKWIASALVDSLGSVAYLEGDYLRAIDYFGRALSLRRELMDKTGIAGSLHALGQATRCQGDLKRALELFEESLALWQELDQNDGIGQVLQNIARIVLRQGDARRAATLFRQSLEILSGLGAHENVLNSITGLVSLFTAQGKFAQAARLGGAVEARRANLRLQLPPADTADYEQCICVTRTALSESAFQTEWDVGHNFSLAQATQYALAELEKIRA